MRLRTGIRLVPAAAALGLVTGCYVNAKSLDHDDEDHGPHGGNPSYPSDPTPPPAQIRVIPYDRCKESSDGRRFELVCANEGADRWWTNCAKGACRQLPVTVHYLVAKNLGTSSTVRVEAFDNPNFRGSPAAVTLMSGFDTSRIGTFRQDTLFVQPGEYYLRAFVEPANGDATPYEYRGMDLVAGSPVGVLGAASGATNAVVPTIQSDAVRPVEISLDQLFEDPNGKPSTEARLRILIALGDGVTATGTAKVLVDVSTHDDFAFKPEYRFEVSGDSLRVVGHEGKAELLTPDLAPGTYFVRAFFDDNANGFLDPTEPLGVLIKDTHPSAIDVVEKRTADLNLVLAKPAP